MQPMMDRDERRRSATWPEVSREALVGVAEPLARTYPAVEAVYLFGSRARGCARPSSDVDLAVLLDTPVSPGVRHSTASELALFAEDRLEVPVDVVLVEPDLPPGLL